MDLLNQTSTGAPGYPRINSFFFDWSSIEISLDPIGSGSTPGLGGALPAAVSAASSAFGPPIRGFLSLDYENKRTGKNVYGTGGKVLGQTRGHEEPTASAKMLKESWDDLLTRLGDGYGEVFLQLVATWKEGATTSKTVIRCTILGPKTGAGADTPDVDLTLLPISIVENGNQLLKK